MGANWIDWRRRVNKVVTIVDVGVKLSITALNGETQMNVLNAQLEVIAAGNNFLSASHFGVVTEKSDALVGELAFA